MLVPVLRMVTKRRLFLVCLALSGLIYFFKGRGGVFIKGTRPSPLSEMKIEEILHRGLQQEEKRLHLLNVTSWGAPVVWSSTRKFYIHRTLRTGLAVLAVGHYSRYLQNFLSSAERFFLPGGAVTYYVLTDNPRNILPPQLGTGRRLVPIYVAEIPGWQWLARIRMFLLARAIKEHIQKEVEFVYCMDVDQEFVSPVGAEILGDLVATLHPEYYLQPLNTFPYEKAAHSVAFIGDGEGDFYYTSELYGGLCSEVYNLAQTCAHFILQDNEMGYLAHRLEESYLNRYLINRRPTCVLSPEYSWWESSHVPKIAVHKIVSLGRECASAGPQKRRDRNC